jgi:RNA polymerase sigma-70 factor (ECF subfamily)
MGRDQARSSEAWIEALRSEGPQREEAVSDLHALLLRAARFELHRRRGALSHVRGEELEDIATQAADDALVAVLAKLDQYRGASRFTTWANKFALLEAGTVFVALALNQVPIDVLAERLGTTRGALYKTLHDARRKLRHELATAGYVRENG